MTKATLISRFAFFAALLICCAELAPAARIVNRISNGASYTLDNNGSPSITICRRDAPNEVATRVIFFTRSQIVIIRSRSKTANSTNPSGRRQVFKNDFGSQFCFSSGNVPVLIDRQGTTASIGRYLRSRTVITKGRGAGNNAKYRFIGVADTNINQIN